MQEIARAADIIPALQHASLDTFSVAKYPYPKDAQPILGWLPGKEGQVYVAVTHSGATLGPLLGRWAVSLFVAKLFMTAMLSRGG